MLIKMKELSSTAFDVEDADLLKVEMENKKGESKQGEEVLFICALAKDDKNVWLESASMCDPNEEIATRFKMVENGEITEEENYRNLLELGIGPNVVRKAMGDEVCNKFVKHCVEGGLAKEMGREDLFDCTQKMNLF